MEVREGLYRFLCPRTLFNGTDCGRQAPTLAPFLLVCNKLYLTTPSHHTRMLRFIRKDRLIAPFRLKVFPEDEGWGSTSIAGWKVAVQDSNIDHTVACAGGSCPRCFAKAWEQLIENGSWSQPELPWWLDDRAIVTMSARLREVSGKAGDMAYLAALRNNDRDAAAITAWGRARMLYDYATKVERSKERDKI